MSAAAAILASSDSSSSTTSSLSGNVLKPHTRILELDALRAIAAINLVLFTSRGCTQRNSGTARTLDSNGRSVLMASKCFSSCQVSSTVCR